MKSVFLIFLLITYYHASAQCELQYDVEVIQPSSMTSGGKIQLKINTALAGPVSVSVYDIMDKDFPLIEEKKILPSQMKNPIEFYSLKPTTYVMTVRWRNCKKTIGGLEGIKIDQK